MLGGTVGQPTINGDFQVRDGTLELYRTNLKISALQADGSFDGDALKLDARGETAKGKGAHSNNLMDIHTSPITGANCYNECKVRVRPAPTTA